MAAERALGNDPEDVSARKIGYDIASFDPDTNHMRTDNTLPAQNMVYQNRVYSTAGLATHMEPAR